jgi:tripartite-type tricarboxylate transporter receptor subunit TctC
MNPQLLAACAIALCAASPVSAQDEVANFYRGKQVRFIVGSAAGGGYDLFARIVARHIVNHIPGNPVVIVQNQPAAGGVVMTTTYSRRVPRTARRWVFRSTGSRPRRFCSRAHSLMPPS